MSNDLFNKKKSRFSIRKLNIGVCSVLLSTLVMIGTSAQADENTDTSVSASAPVTAIVGSNSVKADETATVDQVTSNMTQSETGKTVVPTEESLKQAETTLVEAQKNSEAAETKVKESEAIVTNLDKESKDASSAVKYAEELVSKATEEEKKKAEADIQTKEENVARSEEILSKSKKVDEKADIVIQVQNEKVDDAKKKVLNEATDVRKAEADVKKAEAAFDSATLLKAQQEAKQLDEKKVTAKKYVDDLTNKVGEANRELIALKESGAKKRLTLENELKNAGPEFLTKVITHELKRNEVPKSQSKTSALTSNSFVDSDGKTYYIVANEDVEFNGEKTEIIEVKSKEDYEKPHVIDYKKVSEEVRNYLVELRKINGIDIPVPEVTDKALKYAKARSDEMLAKDELSHATNLKIEDFGLHDSTENASGGSLQHEDTISEKELAYKKVLSYFNDYSNASHYGTTSPTEASPMNYGHRIPLLSASGTGMAVGSSSNDKSQYGTLQFVTDAPDVPVYRTKEGSHLSVYFLADAENKDSDMSHSEFYYNGKRVKFLPKTTFVYVWKETIHTKNPEFEKAKNVLDTFNDEQKKSEDVLTSTLDVYNKQLEKAKSVLEIATAALTEANVRVAELEKPNKEKANVLKTAQGELEKQKSELKNAETELEKQKSELIRLTEIKKVTIENVRKSEIVLSKAKVDLETAKKTLQNLINAPKLLEDAKQLSQKADEKLAKAKADLESDLKALEDAKEKEEVAKKQYEAVYSAYKAYLKSKEDAEREVKIKKEYEEVKRSDSTSVAIVDDKGNIVGYKAVTNVPTLTTLKQSTSSQSSYSAKEAVNQLPNTGGSNSNLLSAIGVFVLGLLGFISKKRRIIRIID